MLSNDFNFEKSVKELEDIASKLENTQISLDESIALFERGVKLSRDCSIYLEKAKQKIVALDRVEEESVDND